VLTAKSSIVKIFAVWNVPFMLLPGVINYFVYGI